MSDDEFQDCVDEMPESSTQNGPSSTDADGFTYYSKDGYNYKIPRKWSFHEIFQYETEALQDIFNVNSPGNTAMTPEMHDFIPTDLVMKYGQKPSRLIFYGDSNKYTDEEIQKIKDFKDWITAQGNEIPEVDNELMRLLYSKHWNHQKAYDGILSRTKFCVEKFPVMVTKGVFEILNSGFLYIGGRDRMYRPILCLKSKMLLNMNPFPSGEDIVTATLMIFEYIKHVMQSPGKIENMMLIINSEGANVFSMPYNVITKCVTTITSMYKCVARAIFVLNAPYTFAYAWKTISYFMDENTARKVQITSGKTLPELLELVAPNQLEEQLGGTAKNKEDGEFWPPILPDNDFGVGEKTNLEDL